MIKKSGLIVVLLLCSAIGAAAQTVCDGFMGVKWGDDVTAATVTLQKSDWAFFGDAKSGFVAYKANFHGVPVQFLGFKIDPAGKVREAIFFPPVSENPAEERTGYDAILKKIRALYGPEFSLADGDASAGSSWIFADGSSIIAHTSTRSIKLAGPSAQVR